MMITAMTTTTATTPPMMAAVLSDDAVVDGGVVGGRHPESLKVLMATGQLLSTSRLTPCTAIVESVWETKVSKYSINCELVTWAVP